MYFTRRCAYDLSEPLFFIVAKKSRARADISGTVEVDDDGVAIANDTILSDESDQEEEKEIKKPAAKQLVKKSSKATK